MRTIRTKVYRFDELTPDAQTKAVELLNDINVDHNWWESTVENQTEVLAEQGFLNADIKFSGFCSQGDGACFDADIDLEKFTSDKRIISITREYCHFHIARTSMANHYSHERTRYVDYNSLDDRYTRINAALQTLSETIEARRLSLSKQIYKDLQVDYEYLTSRESIVKSINAKEYEFFANGKLINI